MYSVVTSRSEKVLDPTPNPTLPWPSFSPPEGKEHHGSRVGQRVARSILVARGLPARREHAQHRGFHGVVRRGADKLDPKVSRHARRTAYLAKDTSPLGDTSAAFFLTSPRKNAIAEGTSVRASGPERLTRFVAA